MQNLYKDTRKLDKACIAAYGLTEEVMMENAAASLESVIRKHFQTESCKRRILILCGTGDNGADGYTLARRLRIDFDIIVFQCGKPKSALCKLQAERAEKCGTPFFDLNDFTLEFLANTGIVVDCIFGAGFKGDLSENLQILLNDVNFYDCYKIACDIPTGLREDGTVADVVFHADLTLTMGAHKLSLFSDAAKDFVGKIECAELGVSRRLFENSSNSRLKVAELLEESDMILPHRKFNNVNKGSFGHSVIAVGEKRGAAILAGSAALNFGAGLVTITDLENKISPELFPCELMISNAIPEKAKAIAFGMGLGREKEATQKYFDYLIEHKDTYCVIDADACYSENLKAFLDARCHRTVLTPHPKEFKAVLKTCGFGEYSIEECVTNKVELIEKFCKTYPKSVLLVKGANPVIGCFDGYKMFIMVNPFGRPSLAKAGSGDVLSGMICALLAQNYKAVDAAVSASLAHALAAQKAKCDYALTPTKLIEKFSEL
ncbi:NAD(P)H-hydrate dehydratase [Treponema zioleckii]|uniref:NAD(P)H-hydrate dehydratase n=1 Tax=Treponema zioleckii TaxID=331680 RepID=UPI00168B5A07|nr:NAD(P)H-hydrate dehydratase [Treponema zioleckii]